MKVKWEVDEGTLVEMRPGGWGKQLVLLNGAQVYKGRRLRGKTQIPFALTDGRAAVISLRADFLSSPVPELRVAGQLVAATEKKPFHCNGCTAEVRPNDRFCVRCGKALPNAEDRLNQKHVSHATGAIQGLAVLFMLSGGALFFIARANAQERLAELEQLDPESLVPAAGGMTSTVSALRDQLIWEPWGILIVNAILAVLMVGLAIWGKRSPLPAVLVATAAYAAVLVTNAIVDPTTIAQGIILKVLIIGMLVRGIQASLALRAAHG